MTSQNSTPDSNSPSSSDPARSSLPPADQPARGTKATPDGKPPAEDASATPSHSTIPPPVTPTAEPQRGTDRVEPPSDLWGTVIGIESQQVKNLESGYVMIRQIGRGNFGEVWLSEAPGGVEVALKLVAIPSGRRVRQIELRSLDLMKRLRHPFLMQVQAFWVSEEQITIAMELADQSLRDRASEFGEQGIPLAELLRHMSEAAEGIDFLHREHVIHRDIKPENLLLLKGHIKVADFGLARFLDESGLNLVATQVAGSPLYMAPEVWEGKPVAASDQYSLAMTYIELRLGRPPFESSSIVTIMKEHLHGQPNLTGLPDAEQKVLLNALAKRPDRRFASCTEMVQALQSATSPASTAAGIQTSSTSARLWLFLLPMLMAVVVGLVAWSLWPAPPAPRIDFPERIIVEYGKRFTTQAVSLENSNDTIQSVKLTEPVEGLSVEYTSAEQAVQFHADVNAPVSSSSVKLLVATSSGELEKELTIDIVDPSTLKIPEHAVLAASEHERIEVDDRIYYKRIDIPLPNGQRIEFTLIPRARLADPPTFYLMTREVTNGWFAEFANQQGAEFNLNSAWQLGALAGTNPLGVDDKYSDYPVVQVTADEAHRFAQWLGGLLPSTSQWDKAAGALEREERVGPYLGDGEQVCVARLESGPCPGGSSSDDTSPFGILDMAGNVSELTRNLLGSKLTVPLAQPLDTDRVILRGNSYHSAVPWAYAEGDDDAPASLLYGEHSPAVGFRVVIEML
ncbi:MAG: bifunctional serine/threonine-protein kinase/formylglycine-generating enzyme family protein [Pirellulaceae bacterium]